MARYSAAAARRIVGVSQRCLDYWDERGIVKPSVVAASGRGSERRYSFDDLLRLSLVKRLRIAGLSLQKIRKGLDALRKRWPANDPLLDEFLVTDGVHFFRQRAKKGQLEDILAGGQLVLSIVAVGKIRQDLQRVVLRLDARDLPRRGHRSRKQRQAS